MSRSRFVATLDIISRDQLLILPFALVQQTVTETHHIRRVDGGAAGVHVDGTVDVLQLKRAARLQWNRLIEVFADGVTGDDAESGYKKRAKTKNRRAETVP